MATIKEHFHKKFNVEYLAVFGSVARGTASPNSDVDFLVRYKETPGLFAFLDLKRYLEVVVGRRVDLVTEGAVKCSFWNKLLKRLFVSPRENESVFKEADKQRGYLCLT